MQSPYSRLSMTFFICLAVVWVGFWLWQTVEGEQPVVTSDPDELGLWIGRLCEPTWVAEISSLSLKAQRLPVKHQLHLWGAGGGGCSQDLLLTEKCWICMYQCIVLPRQWDLKGCCHFGVLKKRRKKGNTQLCRLSNSPQCQNIGYSPQMKAAPPTRFHSVRVPKEIFNSAQVKPHRQARGVL